MGYKLTLVTVLYSSWLICPAATAQDWKSKGVFEKYGVKDVGDFGPNGARQTNILQFPPPSAQWRRVPPRFEDTEFCNNFKIKTLQPILVEFFRNKKSETTDFPDSWNYEFPLPTDRESWKEFIQSSTKDQRIAFASDYWRWLFEAGNSTQLKIDRVFYRDRESWAFNWWCEHSEKAKAHHIDPDWIQAALIDANQRNFVKLRADNKKLSDVQASELNGLERSETNLLNLRGKVDRVTRAKQMQLLRGTLLAPTSGKNSKKPLSTAPADSP